MFSNCCTQNSSIPTTKGTKRDTQTNTETPRLSEELFEVMINLGDFKTICPQCEGNYKCDTGYGENRERVLVDGECPVCDSDPNGEHKEWFINYMETYYECNKCGEVVPRGEDCCPLECKSCGGLCETHCEMTCVEHYECNGYCCDNCGNEFCDCCKKCGYINKNFCKCY